MSLEVALDRAKKHEADLQAELQKSEANFAAAWEAYGSELGGDERSERLKNELQQAHLQRRLLEACRDGKIDLSPAADERDGRKVASLNDRIFLLELELAGVESDINNRQKVRELIAQASK
jgi:hypothetical protein